MSKEHLRLVQAVATAQGRRMRTAWSEKGGEHLALPGVTFVPTHVERHRAESRPTVWSRGAMLFLSGALALLYGACTTWDEHDRRIPYGLLVAGAIALAAGVALARKESRADGARDPHHVHRHGLYLFDDGALVLSGAGDEADDLSKFFPRGRIVGTTYQQAGRVSYTHLVTRSEAGDEPLVIVNAFDVRPVIDAWLNANPGR